MNSDDTLTINRFLEAANNCYYRNIPVETDFLDLYRQNLFNTILKELPPVSHKVMGGYDLAERKVVLFLPDDTYESYIPFSIIKIVPVHIKFFEELTHRDYLGSILALGISRDKIGDIIVKKDCAYLFCTNSLAAFLEENITKIRNTFVKAQIITDAEFDYLPDFEVIKGNVASVRLDAVTALAFRISRNHIIDYIEEGKVYVNGRIITSNAYSLKPSDIISVRGLGKIQYAGAGNETRKGRIMITINKYI